MQRIIRLCFAVFFVAITASCSEKGCTDPTASNFSYNAEKEDGSCEYKGCTDDRAINFDPEARENDGTCIYNGGINFISNRPVLNTWNVYLAVYVNNQYIGNITDTCNAFAPNCESTCNKASILPVVPAYYSYFYYQVTQTSSTTYDTAFKSDIKGVQLGSGDCIVVTLS